MVDADAIKLSEIDFEEISDVLVKIEKSFDLKFGVEDFKAVETYGDICDIITDRICYDDLNDCTSQQAFYKIRDAISSTQLIPKPLILPETPLEQVFPLSGRRKKVKEFSQRLDLKINILSMNGWLFGIFFIGFVASFVAFFFNGHLALTSFLFFTVVSWVASRFSKNLDLQTVGELTNQLARENYLHLRTNQKTVNRQELLGVIDDLFMSDLGLAKENLYRDAPLSWAVKPGN